MTGQVSELVSFHRFLSDRLSSGEDLSPEEVIDRWRAENPSREDYLETVVAVRQALADMRAGDTGVPFEEFDAEMRRKHKPSPLRPGTGE